MEVLIVFVMLAVAILITATEWTEAAIEKIYKRTHNKRKWNEHGSWIIRKEI